MAQKKTKIRQNIDNGGNVIPLNNHPAVQHGTSSGTPTSQPPIGSVVVRQANSNGINSTNETRSVSGASHSIGAASEVTHSEVSNLEINEQVTVESYVTKHLFPYLKFFGDGENEGWKSTFLDYNDNEQSICHMIFSHMNFDDDIDGHEWWKHARRWIANKLVHLRSDHSQAIKNAFFCK